MNKSKSMLTKMLIMTGLGAIVASPIVALSSCGCKKGSFGDKMKELVTSDVDTIFKDGKIKNTTINGGVKVTFTIKNAAAFEKLAKEVKEGNNNGLFCEVSDVEGSANITVGEVKVTKDGAGKKIVVNLKGESVAEGAKFTVKFTFEKKDAKEDDTDKTYTVEKKVEVTDK